MFTQLYYLQNNPHTDIKGPVQVLYEVAYSACERVKVSVFIVWECRESISYHHVRWGSHQTDRLLKYKHCCIYRLWLFAATTMLTALALSIYLPPYTTVITCLGV